MALVVQEVPELVGDDGVVAVEVPEVGVDVDHVHLVGGNPPLQHGPRVRVGIRPVEVAAEVVLPVDAEQQDSIVVVDVRGFDVKLRFGRVDLLVEVGGRLFNGAGVQALLDVDDAVGAHGGPVRRDFVLAEIGIAEVRGPQAGRVGREEVGLEPVKGLGLLQDGDRVSDAQLLALRGEGSNIKGRVVLNHIDRERALFRVDLVCVEGGRRVGRRLVFEGDLHGVLVRRPDRVDLHILPVRGPVGHEAEGQQERQEQARPRQPLLLDGGYRIDRPIPTP